MHLVTFLIDRLRSQWTARPCWWLDWGSHIAGHGRRSRGVDISRRAVRIDLIKCRLFTLRRRQGEHMSDNCSLDFARIWCNSMVYSDLLWGHEGGIIVLNAVTAEFLAVVDEGNRFWFHKVQNLIYSILVLVHWVRWVVYTRFKDRVVLLRLIFLNDCFRPNDLGVSLVTALSLSLILEGRDVATVTNDIYGI